jgi:hypothetical protein
MAITKKALAEKIKRRFGYPMIKVELDTSQIYDAIDYARQKFLKWAVGQATTETFFTIMLSAGENMYDLPVGVVEVVDYGEPGVSSGINTLFTLDNYLYSQGMYDSLLTPGMGGDYTFVSYHLARDFLDVVKRYTPMKYNYKYHRYTNTLEIHPAPVGGTWLTLDEGEFESPGFLLIRSYMIEGSTHIDGWSSGDSNEDFYELDWIFDYASAECKIILGMIRRKFENFVSIGNTGVSLDGGDLISEGKEEKERLEETLRLEEVFDGGFDISIGY